MLQPAPQVSPPAAYGPDMDMQSLFQRIADEHDSEVEALELREAYARVRLTAHHGESETTFEMMPYHCQDLGGARVTLVRVQGGPGDVPVLVSPIPSAILAVALR